MRQNQWIGLAALGALLGAGCRSEPEPVMPKEPVRTPRPAASRAGAATPASPPPTTAASPATASPATAAITPPSPSDLAAEVAPVLEAWRGAWERQALDDYLGFYAGDFLGDGLDLAAWAAKKRRVFARASEIRIAIDELSVRPAPEGAVAEFVQSYTGGTLQDRGRKTLILRKVEGRWRILRESFRSLD